MKVLFIQEMKTQNVDGKFYATVYKGILVTVFIGKMNDEICPEEAYEGEVIPLTDHTGVTYCCRMIPYGDHCTYTLIDDYSDIAPDADALMLKLRDENPELFS